MCERSLCIGTFNCRRRYKMRGLSVCKASCPCDLGPSMVTGSSLAHHTHDMHSHTHTHSHAECPRCRKHFKQFGACAQHAMEPWQDCSDQYIETTSWQKTCYTSVCSHDMSKCSRTKHNDFHRTQCFKLFLAKSGSFGIPRSLTPMCES